MARYSASFVRSWSSVPASSTFSSATGAYLRDDPGHVLGLHVLAIAVVERDDRGVAAAAEALERAQRDRAVVRRLAGADAELVLERLQYLLRPVERAGEVRADLDHLPTHGLQVEHVVEGGDGLAVRGRQVERV